MDNKVKIGIICGTIVACIGIIGFIVWGNSNSSDDTGEGASIQQIKDEKGEVIQTVRYSDTYQSTLEDIYNRVNNGEVNNLDRDVQKLVHWMSNSLIKAKQNRKVGFLKPNPENIEKMILIIEKTKPNSEKFYLATLKEWLNGNFTEVKEVHNSAWTYLDGEIGKATGPDEERIEQIKKDFFKE